MQLAGKAGKASKASKAGRAEKIDEKETAIMKLGFNEATALECKGQSLMADLEACEKYGFDYIEIRFDCVKDYLKEHT